MLLVAGRIGRAHGLRGEVLIVVLTDEPESRFAPGRVLATDPESAGPLTIAAGHVHSGKLMLTFEGFPDRTSVETLRDVLLLVEVDPDELPEDEDEWYDHQLVGLDAVTADGAPLGEVREVLHLPGHDVLAVTCLDGREVLVPFVAEIVPDIDISSNRVVITPPPGLFEELVESDPPPTEA